ncbi:LysM peptidoglycan-binding domain-containing protein [Streptomyces sp. TP-A0874]|uniref:LysM peptidoglycan-binding domain-containing protein n=1 Tax=Streptomyces sp. TP-A0874 TaxID=549819 RepID=UPI0008537573|nr:LysM peptidoglycan-binding domain-containing protein [Streptomyces sp. TP-A0874]
MPAKGKHRRAKKSALIRAIVAASTGGAALALPLTAATTAQAAPAPQQVNAEKKAPAADAPEEQAGEVYTVVPGDSLYRIAEAHSLEGGWQQLYQDNREAVGENPALIHPGLELTVGAPVEAGEAERSAVEDSAEAPAEAAEAQQTSSTTEAATTYSNDLDGWIREALAVMAEHNIPGTYEGIHRNIIRESGGNPSIVNDWDINAQRGTPSKGLLQVIDPTFQAYHVPGTSMDPFDPVANITAACNYAADRYGSIDNVNGPY